MLLGLSLAEIVGQGLRLLAETIGVVTEEVKFLSIQLFEIVERELGKLRQLACQCFDLGRTGPKMCSGRGDP